MAQEWRTPPSELLGVDDTYQAWCLNEAVFLFGKHVEREMNDAEKGLAKAEQRTAARQRALDTVLRDPKARKTKKGKTQDTGSFRDPAAMM